MNLLASLLRYTQVREKGCWKCRPKKSLHTKKFHKERQIQRRGGVNMFTMTDVIISLWFLPVALCIIVPLAMLCGYSVIKLFAQIRVRRVNSKQKDQLKNGVIHAEKS